MSDVSLYTVESKIRTLEDRVKTLEQARLDELNRKTEAQRRKNEQWMRWTTFGIVLVAAVAWTVMITLAVTGRK